MSLHGILLLAFATFVFVMTPGPGVFALISRSLQGGAMAGLALTIGLMTADILYLSAALAGLAFIARDFHTLFLAVRLIGGVYLIALGIRAWRSPATPMGEVGRVRRSPGRDLLAGFLTSASNPKVILFYLGLLPNFVDMQAMTAARFLGTAAVVAFTLAAGALIYIVLCARARRLFASTRAVRYLNRTSAVVLVVAGVLVASGAGQNSSSV
ncbi:LysE family translocator [Salinisphaera hydrothermalis]|uniref:LysE family translocator n=1 Tax=Salinisphaera hydrothermalis TaxID=563188 RepID=UPI00333E2CA0